MEWGKPGPGFTLWLLTAQLPVSNPRSVFVPPFPLSLHPAAILWECLASTLSQQPPLLCAIQHMRRLYISAEDDVLGFNMLLLAWFGLLCGKHAADARLLAYLLHTRIYWSQK